MKDSRNVESNVVFESGAIILVNFLLMPKTSAASSYPLGNDVKKLKSIQTAKVAVNIGVESIKAHQVFNSPTLEKKRYNGIMYDVDGSEYKKIEIRSSHKTPFLSISYEDGSEIRTVSIEAKIATIKLLIRYGIAEEKQEER